MPASTRARYSVAADDVITTVHATVIECVTWASGYRDRRMYSGYTKRQAVQQFRADFTADYPNP